MMQKVQIKVKSRSKMVIIPHLPTNLQPHVNWYSPHKTKRLPHSLLIKHTFSTNLIACCNGTLL